MVSEKLAAGVCFFEKSLPTIQRCIESLKNHIDYIFAIDGRFTDEIGRALFPDTEKLSPEYIRNYLRAIPNVVLVDYPATEIQKRQKYLDMCKQFDCEFLLIIDSDEFILPESDWVSFRNNIDSCDKRANIYGIKFEYGHTQHHDTSNYPRLWHKPYEMEYFQAHCLFRNKNTNVVQKSSSTGCSLVDGIIMAGDDSLRTRDYQVASFEYQTNLIEDEREVREKYR